MPTLLSRNYFITNLKTSHSTRISLKFIVNTQFFNIHVCFCWPQMARGIVSCGFWDQDCKLLDFQIKPCETNHCKPSKSCWLFFFFSFLENVHGIETTRHRSRGADGAALTGCGRSSSCLSFTGASWTGEEVPGGSCPITTLLLQSLLHFQVLWVNTQLLKQQPKTYRYVLLPRVLLLVFSMCTFQNRHVKTKKQNL